MSLQRFTKFLTCFLTTPSTPHAGLRNTTPDTAGNVPVPEQKTICFYCRSWCGTTGLGWCVLTSPRVRRYASDTCEQFSEQRLSSDMLHISQNHD